MNRRAWLIWLAGIALSVAYFSLLIQAHQSRPQGVLTISTGEFSPGSTWSEQSKHSITLPHDWQREPGPISIAWYRTDVDLRVAPNRLWGIYIPGVEMAPIVFVNGVAINDLPALADPLPRYWNRPVYYSIPNGILQPGLNRISIKLAANGQWGRMTELYLGPDSALAPYYESRFFLRVTALQISTVVCFVIALFIFLLWAMRREAVFGWMAGFALAYGVHSWTMLAVDVPIPNRWWDILVFASLGFILISGTLFTLQITGFSLPRLSRRIVLLGILGPLILISLSMFDVAYLDFAGPKLWVGFLALFTLVPTALIAQKLIKSPNWDIAALNAGYLLAVPLAIKDWSVGVGMTSRHDGFMFHYAAGPVLIAFGIILVLRFLQALGEAERLNQTLARRVEEKTKQIEEAHSKALRLESEQIVADERARLMRDMHDGVGGSLIGTLSLLERHRPREALIAQELELALTDLRLMIDSMDADLGDLLSILALFRNRIQHPLDTAEIKLHWKVGDLPAIDLRPERTLHILRILQESVTNVLKHANATELEISAGLAHADDPTVAVIRIADNGCGFSSSNREGRGLTNMHYRAEQSDMDLTLESSASGTAVGLKISV